MPRNKEINSIKEVLHVLKMARGRLVSDFKNEEPNVYLPMFKYEGDSELMSLTIEKYFTSWVNFHFYLWHKHYSGHSGRQFYKAIKNLIIKLTENIGEMNSYNQEFYSNLIYSKIDLLDGLIRVGEKDNKRRNALLLEYEKDKALFEREINRLAGVT